jgi:D-alanyl-lipoteichoic acid acyltransferase DltB (MBOAT superfamily)
VILVFSAAAVFGAARALDSLEIASTRRSVLLAGVLASLLCYLMLIKLMPILHQRGQALSAGKVLVTLGVSYYTFKLMGYLIDVYWRKYPSWTDPVLFLAFATFFPQLPAGPIQRASDFRLPEHSEETARLMSQGLKRIFWGLVKKTVVADQLASMVGYIDGTQPRFSNMLWIAGFLYALQLYFDFAALTDIAVGTAGLFCIKSPENFNYPFFAPSISQFWRRWHMSLTTWITDYVFTPLRMSLRNLGTLGLIVSIMVNMTLIALWHGIGVGILIFGLLNGAFLVVDSLTTAWRRKYYRRHPLMDLITNLIGPVFVFSMVAYALVYFRAVTIANITYQTHHLWDGVGAPISSLRELYNNYGHFLSFLTFAATAGAIGIELWAYLRQRGAKFVLAVPLFPALPAPLRWLVYYAGVTAVVTLYQQHVHFIYVQF